MFGLDKNYIQSISWQGMGNVSAQAVNILSLPIITRLYMPSDLGMLKIFVETLAFFTIIISFRVEHIVILPKENRSAIELFSFVFSLGILSVALFTVLILVAVFFEVIPSDYMLWALILPAASFLLVVSQAAQQLSQRSADFRRSGISEVINRSANSLFAVTAGLYGAHGVMLAIAIAIGFLFKLLVFFPLFVNLKRGLLKGVSSGLCCIRREGFNRLLGSLILSHGLLSITIIAPLWFISERWGIDYSGYFSLVLSTLVLPTALIGRAVGQVYYQRASSLLRSGKSFTDIFAANLKFLVCIAVPGFSIIYFFGPVLYPLIFGEEWAVAGYIAQYYVFAAGMGFVSIPFERSGLVVNAWWYSPIWYILRVVTTFAVIYFVDLVNGTFINFIFWLSIQISVMHIADAVASYLFSLRTYPFSPKLFSAADHRPQ